MPRPQGSKNKATIKKEAKALADVRILCHCCGKEKKQVEFLTATGTRYWITTNGKAPICKTCIKDIFDINAEKYGTRNATLMACAVLDLPFVPSIYNSIREKGNYAIGKYSRVLNIPPWKNMVFIDSIVNGDVAKGDDDVREERESRWTKGAKVNKSYVTQTVGYDPFEILPQADRIDGYRILAGYLDIEGVKEDTHKVLSAINLSQSHLQIKRYDEMINKMISSDRFSEAKLKDLEASRKSAIDGLNKTAKENGFASQNDKDVKSKNTFSGKIQELRENDFEAIKVNLFDINTSEAMKQIADLSHQSIIGNLDDNDYADIVKEQRIIIRENNETILHLEEELRLAKNTIIHLKKGGK